ncbi:DUF937 domain-containing protein [Novosphingobium lentum]|uniref:DUF937 domain-containing protein n=1 Tax=Novosphingobium lentum TaxID=145287 RepID=UPI00082B8B35|nr:DUF937 domain-containing protein [Novosphingobium lentum]
MDLASILRDTGGIAAIAGQLGITPQQAEAGAGALLPSLIHGFQLHEQGAAPAGSPSGGGGLADILASLGGGQLADNVVAPEPTDTGKGDTILGHIFGSKDVSRSVAGEAAQQSGVDAATLRKMLPILAMLVGGYLSSRNSANGGGGGLSSIIGSVLGSMAGNQAGGGGIGGGLLGSILGSVLGGKL